MAVAEIGESISLSCPVCSGPMEAMQTFCDSCRAKLEAEALSAKAEDYPLLAQAQMAQSEPEPKHEVMVGDQKESSTDVEMVPNTYPLDDDEDLVPFADEPKRPSIPQSPTLATAAGRSPVLATAAAAARPAPAVSAPRPTPAARPAPARPGVAPAVPPISEGTQFEPSNRWKYIVVALVALVLTGILSAMLWRYIMPPQVSVEITPAGRTAQ